MTTTTEGEIHGGLLIRLYDLTKMEPITLPFGEETKRGNQVLAYDPVIPQKLDYWHSSSKAERSEVFVAERNISVESRMVGQNAEQVLRHAQHRVISMNAGLRREERMDMLDHVTASVLPTLVTPAMISMEMMSSQPKFLLFSRDIPIHLSIFCDDACMLLTWTNEYELERRMRDHYGNRFIVYRMPSIVNAACVIQTHFLNKKLKRWIYESRGNHLKLLNMLEAFIFRRSKQDTED
jgi:hypothetical protein